MLQSYDEAEPGVSIMTQSSAGLNPIRTPGKFTDAAYTAIRTGIRMGRILPGTRLHEADLALQLGTSKTPVREALGRLIGDGLAVSTFGGKSAVYVPRLSHKEIIDLYEARGVIEPPLARMAAEKASEAEVAVLGRILSDFQEGLEADDIYTLMELDSELHAMIASISGNRALAQSRERLDNAIAIARVTSVQNAHYGTSAHALKEHSEICRAIAEHDGARAERHMAQHIRRRRDDLIGKWPQASAEDGADACEEGWAQK